MFPLFSEEILDARVGREFPHFLESDPACLFHFPRIMWFHVLKGEERITRKVEVDAAFQALGSVGQLVGEGHTRLLLDFSKGGLKGIFSLFGVTLREGPDAGLSPLDEQIQGLRPFCGLGLGCCVCRGVKNSSKAFSAEGSGPFGDGEGQSVGRGHFGVCTCRRQEEGGQFFGERGGAREKRGEGRGCGWRGGEYLRLRRSGGGGFLLAGRGSTRLVREMVNGSNERRVKSRVREKRAGSGVRRVEGDHILAAGRRPAGIGRLNT